MDTPHPPAPGKLPGVSALKGHKPATYALLGGGILIGAYFIHKREAQSTPQDATAQDATAQGQDAAYSPTAGYGDGSYYPDPTQGAGNQNGGYLGLDYPAGGAIPTGNGYLYDPATGLVYGVLPSTDGIGATPIGGGPLFVPSLPVGTGGGPPGLPAAAHSTPPLPVYTPGGVAAPAPIPQGSGPTHVLHECSGKYPHSSERGCYRIVHIGSHTWHYYGPHDAPKIKVS